MKRPGSAQALWIILAACTAACSGGAGLAMTPTAPSTVGSTPSAGGAVISGRVNTVAPAPAGVASADRWTSMATRGITVTVVGSSVSAVVDGGGQFTLNDVPAGTVQLKFSGQGVDASLTMSGVSATDRIEISVTLSGSNARLDSDHRTNNGVEVNGLVSAVNVGARTLQVAGQTVTVPPTAVLRHGSTPLTMADVKVGDRVQVKGTRSGTSVTATEVKVEDVGNDNSGPGNQTAEVTGAVAALSGTCPSISFTVGATRVSTTAATTFKDGACSLLRNGTAVEAKGRRNADGSILATEVENKSDDDDDDGVKETEVSGTVGGLSGSCPALAFTVAGTAVKTDAKTDFRSACSAVKAAAKVEVKGVRQTDGKLLATRLKLDD